MIKKTEPAQILIFLIKALVMAVLFLPLLLNSKFFFPFIVPKNISFRILVEVALGLYLILIMFNASYRPKINKLTLSIIIFFGITVVASLLGDNFAFSFWGDYERMSGVFHNLHLLAFFIILANVFKRNKDWYQLFAFTIFIALLASVLGLSQQWQIPQLIKSSGGERLTGPIGNAAFFAGYLMLHVFFVLFFLIKKKSFPNKFFSYVVLGFNLVLIVVEIYKKSTDQIGFLAVTFDSWQLLSALILLDAIAIYLWFLATYDFVGSFSNRFIKYILNNFPLFIIIGTFLYVIYNTQTRGALLSIWISLVILFTIGFYLKSENKSKSFFSLLTLGLYNSQNKKRQLIFALLIVLILVSQIFVYFIKDSSLVPKTGTLSRLTSFVSIIALYLSILSVFIVSLFFEKDKTVKILLLIFLFVFIASPVFVFLSRNTSWVQSVPVVNTVANIASSPSITIESRVLTWQASYRGMLDRPIFGWGLENFDIVFNKYFPPEIFKDQGSRVWFDRAHNVIFDIGVTTGFIGLISYLSIFGIAIHYLIKKFKTDNVFTMSLFFIIVLFAYFIQNLFVFDTLNTEIIIFLILAFIAFLADGIHPHQTEVFNNVKLKQVNLFLIFVVFVPIIILIFGVNIKTMQANNFVFQAVISKDENGRTVYKKDTVDNFINAIEMSPIGKFEVREQMSSYTQSLAKDKQNPREDVSGVVDIAIRELKKSIEERPNDVRQYLYYANLLNATNEFDSNNPAEVIKLMEKAQKLSPTRPPIYFELGQAYLFQQEYDKAVEYFKKGVDKAPWVVTSHLTLAELYVITNRTELALSEIDFVRNSNKNNDITPYLGTFMRFADLFVRLEKHQEAINLIEEAILWAPDNIDYRIKLATLYAEIGEKEKAILEANKVIEIDPSLREATETFIDSLKEE